MHDNDAARGWGSRSGWTPDSLRDLKFRHATIPRPWFLELQTRLKMRLLALSIDGGTEVCGGLKKKEGKGRTRDPGRDKSREEFKDATKRTKKEKKRSPVAVPTRGKVWSR
jgi:hypothetical protein